MAFCPGAGRFVSGCPVIRKYSVRFGKRETERRRAVPIDASYHRATVTVHTVFGLLVDVLHFARLGLRSHARLAAENLFLRKQLALYLERQAKPRRANNATRLTLVVLARFIEWRAVLTIVQPDTLVRWHRHAFRLFWRWTSRHRGRPRIPRSSSN